MCTVYIIPSVYSEMWRVMSQFLDERFEDVAWKDSTYSSRIEDYDYRLHFVVFYSSQKVN